MKKTVFICIIICIISGTAYSAEDRGLKINVKTRSDTIVPLYSDYQALVIGAGNYEKGWPKLPKPSSDAVEITETLKKIGFRPDNIHVIIDPSSSALKDAFNRLVKESKEEDKAIFIYFAGHGHTLKQADGTPLGYIVPVDTPDPDLDVIGFMEKAISMRDIETYAQLIKSRHVLMMFDSCFSGALFTVMRDKPSPYIEEKIAHPVRQFITAGQENESVPDKSVFKEVFIQGVKDGYADMNRDGYVTGEELGYYMQENVVNYSYKRQHPQFGKINNPRLDKGDFVFQIKKSEEITKEALPRSGERPAEAKIKTHPDNRRGEVFHDPVSGGEFVFIGGGCFQMGDIFGDGEDDEKPVHEVCIKDFYMGKFEVTVGEFRKFVNATGYKTDAEKAGGCYIWSENRYEKNPDRTWRNPGFTQTDQHPVVCVSWNDSAAFLSWLSGKTGKDYRLPAEAEWEYAAGGGDRKEKWAGTNNELELKRYAWFADNSEGKTYPVGQRQPNRLGLYDMNGNVWEFVQDFYDLNYYSISPKDEPSGPDKGDFKGLRGGSYKNNSGSVRNTERYWDRPDYRSPADGFRCSRGGN